MFSVLCFGQSNEIDSLKNVIARQKDDTTKVNTLIELCKLYIGENKKEALEAGLKASELADKIDFKRGKAYALKFIGIYYYQQENFIESLLSFEQSIDIFNSINDKVGESNIANSIGSVYFVRSEDVKALEYYLRSLFLAEEIKNNFRITTALINIGNVYQNKKQTLDKALVYYLKALPYSRMLDDADILGTVTVGIGEIYLAKKMDDSALYYFELALSAYEGTEEYPYALNDIGKVYLMRKDYKTAEKYHSDAFAIAQKNDSKLYMTQSLMGLAKAQQEEGNYKESVSNYKNAESISLSISSASYELKTIYEGLAYSYNKLNDYKNAFTYQLLLTSTKDTLYNIDTDKKLGSLQFDFDIHKKQSEINLLTKDKEIQEQEIRRQKIVRNSFIGGFAVVLIFAGIFFRQRNKIKLGKKRSDELLLNILPEETAEELKATGTAKAKSFDSVSVMFTDFKNFTQASEILTPDELVAEINYCYSEFDRIITRHGIEKIKTIGDSYMCVGGLPVPNATHAEDVVRAGLEMQQFIIEHKSERIKNNEPYFDLRLGIHTGTVVAGIVGIKKFAYDIWGDTVNTASRMESSGQIEKVNISGTTYELIKDKFTCTHRGKIEAKNKGQIDMYFVES